MNFETSSNEKLFVSTVTPERDYSFSKDLKNGLTIIWNVDEDSDFTIDNRKIKIEKNCIIFLTEFHFVEMKEFSKLNVIQFNRGFYCVEQHDAETGCKGLLFYGASSVPKIYIPKERQEQFKAIWDVFKWELAESDNLKIEMLRSLLKRFLILCLRVYKKENKDIHIDDTNIELIREFNYLVESNFKNLTMVSDYAELLHKSPKTLSNLFNKHTDKTPLKIINERRMLEARRLLKYTDVSIQEIADELNFADAQAFSNFFKKKDKISPSQFRRKFIAA